MLLRFVGGGENREIILGVSAPDALPEDEICCFSDFILGWTDMRTEHVLFEKAANEGAWTEIYRGTDISFPVTQDGGRYFYKVETSDGRYVDEAELIYKPDPILAAVLDCDEVILAWGDMPDVAWQLYRDDTLIATLDPLQTGFTDTPPTTGTLNYRLVGTVQGEDCTGEDFATIDFVEPTAAGTLLAEDCINNVLIGTFADGNCEEYTAVRETFEPAGTLLSSNCQGNQTVGRYSTGDCGETLAVIKTWPCSGCTDGYPTGYIAPAECYNGNVARKRRDNPCSSSWYWQVIKNCECGCSGGDCIEKVEVSDGFDYPRWATGVDKSITFQQNGGTALPNWLQSMDYDGFQHEATCDLTGRKGRSIRISIKTWPATCTSSTFTVNVGQSFGKQGCNTSWATTEGPWSSNGFTGIWSITCQGFPNLTLNSFTVKVACLNPRLECP